MSWFKKIKDWFEFDEQSSDVKNESSEGSKFEFINKYKSGLFYTSETKVEIATGKIVSSSYDILPLKLETAVLPADVEILDMKLRNSPTSILGGLDKNSLSDLHFYVIIRDVVANRNKYKMTNLYETIFDTPSGEIFCVAYTLLKKHQLARALSRLESSKSDNNEINVSNSVLSFYKEFVQLIFLLEVVYPAFAKDLYQLNALEKFFLNVKSKCHDVIGSLKKHLNVKDSLLELKSSVDEMLDDFFVSVVESNLKSSYKEAVSGGDWRDKIFAIPFVNNNLPYPCADFGDDINRYFELIKINLSHVNESYVNEDLSNEIPKMFSDVLSDVIKNFIAMPEVFRKTMKNDNNKTVEDMLIDVLEKINNRLSQIAQSSHEGSLREVSVLNEFSNQKWSR